MDKLTLQTPNMTAQNIKKIAELFPNCITETRDENGALVKAVNFEMLKQTLSPVVEGSDETYDFTWVGKKAAMVEAYKPISKTLRPCPEESVDWDNTQNLYIEGDNLEVLKLLQESYLKKVKMIYIDPPYNTGNDFVYRDDFRMSAEEWNEESGAVDEEGNRLVTNSRSSGRFHSDWCSMIYSRLLLARGLLTDDGAIFISIDDNEVDNLKRICDDVFGTANYVATIIWKRKRGRDNSARWLSKAHEYCLLYAKNKDFFDVGYLELDEETKNAYKNPDNDPRGIYRMLGCWARGTQGGVKYDFTTKEGQYFSERLWLLSKENLTKLDLDNKLIIRGDNIYRKMFIYENKGKIPETLWDDVSNAANASDEIKKLFERIVFDTPKPIPYIQRMIQIATNKDDLILDFFSGSATTAHAVMQLNAEDGGNRRFIMVQIPEKCNENSEAYKAGYKTICDIGKERIRRAGAKIKESMNQDDSLFSSDAPALDTGFRVFKVDDSNRYEVELKPGEYTQDLLSTLEDNIKPDRTPLDLLFGCALEWGLSLSAPYKSEQVDGFTIHTYSSGDKIDLIACFDENVPESVFEYIAKKTPQRIVFRDRCFKDCPSKINAEMIIKTLSPDTTVKVV